MRRSRESRETEEKDRGGEREYRKRWSRRGEGRQMNSWEKKKKGEEKKGRRSK